MTRFRGLKALTATPGQVRTQASVLAFVFLLLLLIAARVYLPYWLKDYVNQTLARIPGYHGTVGHIEVHLWRGAYTIHHLALKKTNGKVPVPFFSVEAADFSVQWNEIFNGALVGEIDLFKPVLNFVNAENAARKQTSINRSWQSAVRELFPLRINHFRGEHGEIHFRDFEREPQVDILIRELLFRGDNLTNSLKISKSLIADIDAQGIAESKAPVKIHVRLNPFLERPAFHLDASVVKLNLTKLNDFFKAYANFDVQAGEFELYTELESDGENFKGYIKPFLKDSKVVSLKHDSSNPLRFVWEALVGFVAEIVENQSREQIAAKIPLSGRFADPNPDFWQAIGSLLSNAFIQALLPGIEQSAGTKSELPLLKKDHED